mmetsp:Transcript_19226/g.49648  ORF Transcript_19226/g.49648 Transcript_19226/m.49648 type:complete len:234 (+) Transcript_19226:933-1634(+)
MMNAPVPYVLFAIPGEKHTCPKVAACWSPRMPLIGTLASSGAAWLSQSASRAPEGTMVGSMARGTLKISRSSASHSSVWMFMSSVRHPFETSVMCESPHVRFQMSHVSIVPKSASPFSAAMRRPGTFSKSHTSFVAEKYGTIGRPVFLRSLSRPPPASAIRSAIESVRVQFHTIALCSGLPVLRSHTIVVSRWLVIPIPATSSGATPRIAAVINARTFSQISMGSCSTQPARG